jgi:propionyl-CoA carboxylase alpha chain
VKRYRIELHTPLRDIVIRGSCNGEPFCAQIERIGLAYRVMHNGAQIDAKVFTPRVAQLNALMPVKAPPDLSRFLISPMPGLLVDVAVQPGQSVRAGEKLAVIEAMKMENILLASQDGVVEEVVARQGESLAVDQVILKFR